MSADLQLTRWKAPLRTNSGQDLTAVHNRLWDGDPPLRRPIFVDMDFDGAAVAVITHDDDWTRHVTVVSMADGKTIWDSPVPNCQLLEAGSNVVLTMSDVDGGRCFQAFDLDTGRQLWTTTGRGTGRAALLGDTAMTASFDPLNVSLVDSRTGAHLVTVRDGVQSFKRVPAQNGAAFTDSGVSYLVTRHGERVICTGRLISGNRDVLIAQDDDRIVGWQVDGSPSWEAQLPDNTEVTAAGSLRWTDFVVIGQGDQLTWVEAKTGDVIGHATCRRSGGDLWQVAPTAAVVVYDDGFEVVRSTPTRSRMLAGVAGQVAAWRRVELSSGRASALNRARDGG